MLSLAYLALCYQLTPPSLLLIEEPETGVHHASLKDIVETLKQLTKEKGVQVIMTTHSPYLLDHVEAEQVHVFTKDPEGAVHAKRLSEFEDVSDMKSHFMSGEIWSILAEAHRI
jgi:predicted ATPase